MYNWSLSKTKTHKSHQKTGRKSTLATFFDVKTSLWHVRLLYKLKNIGMPGTMFQYNKNFLSERCICSRVGHIHLSRIWHIGIPQGSIIAPILFTLLLIHDLPKALSKSIHVAQYAGDIAICVNTTHGKHTIKRVVNYVQKLYQSELNKLIIYMKENGLELSIEKTCLKLFNSGEKPKRFTSTGTS